MSKAALLELADRVEKTSEGHCYLDAEIDAALKLYPKSYPWIANFSDCRAIQGRVQVFNDNGESSANWAPPSYTSSLDAAMTLIPKGGLWSVCDMEDGPYAQIIRPTRGGGYVNGLTTGKGCTAVTSLTAACLRARAQQEPSDAR